mgnify:CR=1 FL=1
MVVEVIPLDILGTIRARGLDLSAKVQHSFSNDFWIILNGTFTYNKAVYKELEEATDKPYWQLKTGYELSQRVGYIAEGLFRDQAEIDNSPQANTGIMPGDIRYRDVDGNGVIDVNDADRPDDTYIVIGAFATGDHILCQKGSEKISVYDHESGEIDDELIYDDFLAFLKDLYDLLGIGE